MDLRGIVVAFLAVVFSYSSQAINVGQLDNFQDGTTQNWTNGGVPGVPPIVNVDTGGPGGVGDRFIEVTSVSEPPGNRLTTFNRDQWLGDYIGAGVTAIEMDLKNFSDVALSIRVAFKAELTPSSPGYLSMAIVLPAGSGWQHMVFSLSESDLIAIGGPDPYNTFFSSGIAETRIINEFGDTNLNGDIVVGQLGIDNIHAVPEPTATVLLTGSLLALIVGRVRVRQNALRKARSQAS